MNLCPRSYIRFMCVNVSLSLFVCLCVVWDQVFRVHLLRLIGCDIIDILDFLRYSRFAECHIDILIVNGISFYIGYFLLNRLYFTRSHSFCFPLRTLRDYFFSRVAYIQSSSRRAKMYKYLHSSDKDEERSSSSFFQ